MHSIADSACEVDDRIITLNAPNQGGFFGRGFSVTFRVGRNYRAEEDFIRQGYPRPVVSPITTVHESQQWEYNLPQTRDLDEAYEALRRFEERLDRGIHMPGYNRAAIAMQKWMEENP